MVSWERCVHQPPPRERPETRGFQTIPGLNYKKNRFLLFLAHSNSSSRTVSRWRCWCCFRKLYGGAPPCDASCPRSECEEELVCGISSEGPNLKRGTPATWGELTTRNKESYSGIKQQVVVFSELFILLKNIFI